MNHGSYEGIKKEGTAHTQGDLGSVVSAVGLVKQELEIPGNTGNEKPCILREALMEQFHRAEFWGCSHRVYRRGKLGMSWRSQALSSFPACSLGERIQPVVAAGEGQSAAGTPQGTCAQLQGHPGSPEPTEHCSDCRNALLAGGFSSGGI